MFRTAPQNACCRMAINSYTNKKHLLQAKQINAFVRVAVVTCRDSIKSSCCNPKENLFILYEKRVPD
jgi:hypothetical protein